MQNIDVGTCPQCPSAEPAPLSTCNAGLPDAGLSCTFTNACGGTDTAACTNGSWSVLRGDCET
ncbi:MAG: hypothetical protein FWD17_13035 [Polyangiaceae bacterium]|nr:hypothetical protein [Polyangiaceae bacterium]